MRSRSDDALSEVIGFILIIALITVFLSLWMTYVIPAEGRQQEIEHMNYVRDWFTQYKITADSIWVNHGVDKSLSGNIFSNSLTLGSQGGATQAGGLFLPVMRPIGSTGEVAVRNYQTNGNAYERIEIDLGATSLNYTLGRLEFSTTNNYWVPQTYYYQMGGVFLKQPTGTVVRVAPLFGLQRCPGNTIDIYLTIIQIAESGIAGISGQGPVRVDSEMVYVWEYHPIIGASDPVIRFYVKERRDAEAWWRFLREKRMQSGLSDAECPIILDNTVVEVRPQLPATIYYRTVRYSVSLQMVATGVE